VYTSGSQVDLLNIFIQPAANMFIQFVLVGCSKFAQAAVSLLIQLVYSGAAAQQFFSV
jgi:hypothetical protein